MGKNTKKEEVDTEEMETVDKKSKKMKGGNGSKKSKSSKSKSPKSKSSKSKSKSKSKSSSKSKKDSDECKKRYFKLIDPKTGKGCGRYTGDTPKQAASKGYTKKIQKLKLQGKKAPAESKIYLRESTRGSARKVYGYSASRIKLDEPQTLKIPDNNGDTKEIVYNYRNKIKKIPVPEQIGGVVKKSKKSNKKSKKSGSKSEKSKKSKSKNTKSKKGTKSTKKSTKK